MPPLTSCPVSTKLHVGLCYIDIGLLNTLKDD